MIIYLNIHKIDQNLPRMWANLPVYGDIFIAPEWAKLAIYDLLTKFPEYAAIDRMHANMLYGQNWHYGLNI